MNGKHYKLMAYVLSTGLWDGFGCITLEQALGVMDDGLAADLAAWQTEYNDQFMRYPYAFDWEAFNARGELLATRIRERLPSDAEIYYEPSDDREFFSPDKSRPVDEHEKAAVLPELALRDRKRTLLHTGLGSSSFLQGK